MSFLTEIDNLKILYKEILDGYSSVEGSSLLVKHLDEMENIEVARYKLGVFNKHIKDGIPSSEDRLKIAIESGQWVQTKEDKILELKYGISDNEKNVKNIIPQQQGPILRVIEKMKKELNDLLWEKQNVLGDCADTFAERESFNYLVFMSIYKSIDNRLFESYDDFEDLDEADVINYGQMLEKALGKFSHKVIAQIACMPFFINPFSYVKENIYYFLSKPMSKLSNYQSALFSLGSRNLGVLNSTDKESPEILDDTKLDDIQGWYDKEFSILLGKRRSAK